MGCKRNSFLSGFSPTELVALLKRERPQKFEATSHHKSLLVRTEYHTSTCTVRTSQLGDLMTKARTRDYYLLQSTRLSVMALSAATAATPLPCLKRNAVLRNTMEILRCIPWEEGELLDAYPAVTKWMSLGEENNGRRQGYHNTGKQ